MKERAGTFPHSLFLSIDSQLKLINEPHRDTL
jgi:hypothetical protein